MPALSQPYPSLLHGVYPEAAPAAVPDSPVSTWLGRTIDRIERRVEAVALGRDATRGSDAAWLAVCSSWEKVAGRYPGTAVLRAAKLLCRDRVSVELSCPDARRQALCLAALKMASSKVPVHLVFPEENPPVWPRLQAVAVDLGVRLGRVAAGDSVEQRRAAYQCDIVAVSYRQLVFDYLLDRQKLSGHRGRLRERLHGALANERDKPVLRGLNCALLADASALLIDCALQPIAISSGAPPEGHSRAVYTEAIECAGALRAGEDYNAELQLTDRGEEHLARLSRGLGPLWRGPVRSRSLVKAALHALAMEQGRDYVLAGEQVSLTPGLFLESGFVEQDYRQFIRVRHGLAGEAQGVIQRICVQHFFPRYCHLSGASPDATPHRRELSSVYSLCTLRIPSGEDGGPVSYRVFSSAGARCTALQQRVTDLENQGLNPLLLWPDEEARVRDLSLAEAGGSRLGDVAYLLQDELGTLEESLQGQNPGCLIAAATPASLEIDSELRRRLGSKPGLEVYASRDEPLFAGVSRWRRFLLPYSNIIYRRVRYRLLDPERRRRRQVADQDAYIRQTLAFSGDVH